MSERSDERTSGLVAAFSNLLEPIADDFSVDIVDVEYNGGVMKVVIDQPDGLESGVLVEVTKAVSRMIDAEDPIPGRFTLEVTSPGVERPLKRPDHFRRAVGETVAVKTNPDVEGERRIEGTLAAADDFGITIAGDAGDRTVRYGEIRSARTTFDWGPTPKQGGPKQNTNKKESADK
jgi:ribosome maturation factor RimP